MPGATLYLAKLRGLPHPSDDAIIQFLKDLVAAGESLVWAARVRQPVVPCFRIDVDALINTAYDVAFLVLGGPGLPDALSARLESLYSVHAGVPSRVLKAYPSTNQRIQLAAKSHPRPLPFNPASFQVSLSSDSRNLQVSHALLDYARRLTASGYTGSVSQINLLAFTGDKDAKASYHCYGQGFVEHGGKHGGNAKIVGNVVAPEAGRKDSRPVRAQKWWDEVAIAHYPTIDHFVDMAADPAYQKINAEFRLPALFDTTIISTTDFDLVALGLSDGTWKI
ncbi:hypothetical protein M427DRAFT_142173 [Gonapodya prolifera JEL478]|uniref:Uncharacterized protein n=1 Tax=Gonapodya prolifera (strain JEL478) TaxID=1344416 RepID=A0A139AYK7_GONPJ|nr:hypothetical protein M427DRAFT_142173 [Gonapodya prolifera JEL478]|eukprot:KXS21797.1 hypothetical protein M427DRAFT_142173 [Gonapodya prolifera JEL478]